MKLKYIGETIILSLTNNKIYDVIEIDNDLVRIIDDEEEDYLYSIIRPKPLDGSSIGGIWEVVEDNENNDLKNTLEESIDAYIQNGYDFENEKLKILDYISS
ncbi:MAG: hypothetical protein RR620_12920 [Clostridium sp.]